MRKFDALTIPLDGQQLIEASAGTGKTYSIALLYLRLIVEGGLDVDKILVVTFTTSATEELRQRIRSRLREALDVLEEAGGDGEIRHRDKVLMDLLGSLENRREAVQRLTDTLARMDESAVFTIHSFCQRMLQDHAFESGAPFDTEFIESELLLRREIIQDFWRQRFYPAPQAETAWATSIWGDPAGLAHVLAGLQTRAEVVCIPEVSAEQVDYSRAESRRCLQAVVRSWRECGGEIAGILRQDGCLSRDKSKGYGPERVEAALTGMSELVSLGEDPWLLPEGTELLAASVMADKLKGKKIPPLHPFFTLFDAFYHNNREFLRLARIQVLRAADRFFRTELEARKHARAQMYFDDLLTGLDRAIAGPEGARLALSIQARFTVALVDEFQDTDPLQYRIFHTLFGQGARPGLFMIGDPKQSIYSFRGADVFAYIQAKKDTAGSAAFTMETNYRSTSAMVAAVNRLFNQKSSFVFGEDIPFSPVRSGGKADEEPFVVRNASPEPLQAMILPVADFAADNKNTLAKAAAESAAARWTALEISRLLRLGGRGEACIGRRPVTGSDLAVLVRTHREAAMIQQELSRLRLTSVYYSQDSVFASVEAWELSMVLAALLDLSVMAGINSALASDLFGMDAHALERLQSDPAQWDEMIARLEEYHLRWRGQGVAAMLQQLLAEQKVVQRLIRLPGGERKLTNYLHLAELLQEASNHQAGMAGLVRWLDIQRHEPEETRSSQQLRLESDEDLVRIVTVHKAKGLEYPVVFLPFPWSCRPVKPGEILSFHHPDTLEQVVDLGTGDHEHYLRAERERLAEDLRLLYVAVTRARYCCYFSWGRVSSMDGSAMAWLLHRDDSEQEPSFAALTEERISRDLSRLNRDERLLGYPVYPREVEKPVPDRTAPAATLTARTFHGRIDTGWSISSYSKMLRTAEDATRTVDDAYQRPESLAEMIGGSVFAFPRGPAAGTCLHGIFEHLDFAAYSQDELRALAEDQLRRTGLDSHWAPLVCRWVTDMLNTTMDKESGLQLRVLGKDDRLVEMGFYFAMQRFNFTRLNQILGDFGYSPVETKSEELTGLMKGFIDLVFHYRGRYFLADYKSNYLGPSPQDYRAEVLAAAMQEHRYDLQYLIYTVAMHRYLGTRIRDYDYTRHFGGVYYLFLRGLHPDHSPGNGIFYTLPPRELIGQLDACFGSMEEG